MGKEQGVDCWEMPCDRHSRGGVGELSQGCLVPKDTQNPINTTCSFLATAHVLPRSPAYCKPFITYLYCGGHLKIGIGFKKLESVGASSVVQ